MANSQTLFHPDQSSLITYLQHPQPNNNFVQQPSFYTNYMPQPMQNLEDNSDPTIAMNKTLTLMAKALKLNTIPTNKNQRSSLISRNFQIAQPDRNTSQDIKMQMVDDNVGNQVRRNAMQNDGNEVGQNAVQNPAPAEGNSNGSNDNQIRCFNGQERGHHANTCTVKPKKQDVAYLMQQIQIARKEEAGIQLSQKEFDFMADASASEEIERVQMNCTSEDTLQQASTSGTQSDNALIYDLDGSTEVPKDEHYYDHDIFNILTHELLYTDLQTELDPYNDMQQKIKRLQAQLGDLKGKSSDTQCASNTLDPVSQKLEDENVPLEFQVSKPKGTTKVLFKVDKMNALSKLVTSNSAPSTRESKVVQTVNVIATKIFRPNPSKTSRVDNVVPNKPVKTSVRIKPITVSQPNVIHKQQANSNLNGFSSTRVNNTAKTRIPHPRSNSNTDRVPSKSKSSCLLNNVEKIKENYRNSQIPKNQKHMSSECNNIMLAIRNAKFEIIFVMCKQCLVTANNDVCVLNYVNNMKSHADNRSANVSISENQKKHKANAKKSKGLGSKGSLASSRPSKPRTCLRWIPTRRIFSMCRQLTASSNNENKSEKSMCDNASTSNPSEPSSKGFPISTSLLGRLSRLKK
ncbi:hypothetical protein Tco_0624776 [Tanacetum coccineum]|uniref:Uncharacterized protein n=1 Tax=Tanacetum coccineum TaxID=301880 RepID=A0ABQ4WEW7_9ASTR